MVQIHRMKNSLAKQQLDKLRSMLQIILSSNDFYRKKFSACALPDMDSPEKLKQLPFTTKSELVEDQRFERSEAAPALKRACARKAPQRRRRRALTFKHVFHTSV